MTVLDEDKVIDAVAAFLRENGYSILNVSGTTKHGFDIEAQRDHRQLIIEAKGEGSVKPSRKRDHFTSNQCRQSVEAGLYKLASHFKSGALLALALPATEEYRKHVRRIGAALSHLDIGVFWVEQGGVVTKEPFYDVGRT